MTKFKFDGEIAELTSATSGCTAREIEPGVWVVSWVEGEWTFGQVTMAMLIAEIVTDDPPLHSSRWLTVENFLTQLGLDLAVLDNLIDPCHDEEATS